MDPFIGEIRAFGFNFAPVGWATCAGQTLPINQNQALFSLLGTTYGGDGRVTFALPDLQGRVPIGAGQGSGLAPYVQGEEGGVESVTLTTAETPSHTHQAMASNTVTTKNPADGLPGPTASGSSYGTTADSAMNAAMIGTTGGSQPHENRQPYLVLNWCIATQGIFPSRP